MVIISSTDLILIIYDMIEIFQDNIQTKIQNKVFQVNVKVKIQDTEAYLK
jgi:hypothetical protein